MTAAELTAAEILDQIDRDRWQRPLIKQETGKPIAYQRPSTLCKVLDDGTNLARWAERMVAVGLSMRVDLAARVTQLVEQYDEPVKECRAELSTITAKAKTAAGDAVRRDLGTELHGLTEDYDLGRLGEVPSDLRADLDAYIWGTTDVEMLATELFVVNDEARAAGTLDRLVRFRGRVIVGDLKTGQWDATYPMGVEQQVATYARGSRYDPATGDRRPLHPDIDTSVGLLIHSPVGQHTTTLYPLDLDRGWRNVQLALQVQAARKGNKALSPEWTI